MKNATPFWPQIIRSGIQLISMETTVFLFIYFCCMQEYKGYGSDLMSPP